MMQRGIRPLILLFPALVLVSGCGDDVTRPIPPDPSNYLPQSSPANCLKNLRVAYVERNIGEYAKLFSDDFTFVFNLRDSGARIDPTPVFWQRLEELASAGNMLGSGLVDGIDLSFQQDAAVDSDSIHAGTSKVLIREIRLAVATRKEDGTQLTLLVPDGEATFFFRSYPNEQAADGKALWRIVWWEDQPVVAASAGAMAMRAGGDQDGWARSSGALLTEETSWGQIKALFL